jgi:hypothetical protein
MQQATDPGSIQLLPWIAYQMIINQIVGVCFQPFHVMWRQCVSQQL